MGKTTKDKIQQAMEIQKEKGGPLGQILIGLGYIDELTLNFALAFQSGMQYVDLDKTTVPEEVIKMVPAQMANTYKIVPVSYDDGTRELTVALGSSDNFRAVDDLRTLMSFEVKARITDPAQLERALAKFYANDTESIGELINELVESEQFTGMENRGASIDLDTLQEMAQSNPIRRLVNMVLLQAIRDRASDVHFEPFQDEFKMRYRIDGVLYEMIPPPKSIAVAIASRIKVMANLDIAERRLPQDGRIELVVNGQPVDLRVSVLPTMHGESVVMRVLDRSNVKMDVARVGFRDDDLQIFEQLINRPNGVIIVTGPTGSGKTTTLYAALARLNTPEVKILTAEDPVEYDVDGLIQCQINTDIGMTFARALRSFLRQDPDIILIGEIRDLETAKIAVESALTGHIVFTTLHTNDAPSSVARLLDLGLEPFLITATMEGVVAQRLVRRICTRCKEEFMPTEEMLLELQLRPEDVAGRVFYKGAGCDFCRGTGYSGRSALFEIMILDDEMRELIQKRASTNALRSAARRRGMRTLREGGLLTIFDGVTTIEEVVAQTIFEEAIE
jgi:type IV pilus assembly protein PilB